MQRCRARLALLSWKLSTFLLKMLLYTLRTQMEKNIRRKCGIEKSSRLRRFADFAIEDFYIVQE